MVPDWLMKRCHWEGKCLICDLTPSQIYANIKGYGKAHRYVYEINHGDIPEDMMVCHECDTPRCINDEHLFLSDAKGNMDDKCAKGRQHRGGPGRTLNIQDFNSIVILRYANYSYRAIGDYLNVSRRTIRRFLECSPHD